MSRLIKGNRPSKWLMLDGTTTVIGKGDGNHRLIAWRKNAFFSETPTRGDFVLYGPGAFPAVVYKIFNQYDFFAFFAFFVSKQFIALGASEEVCCPMTAREEHENNEGEVSGHCQGSREQLTRGHLF